MDDKRTADTLWPMRHMDAASHRALLMAQPVKNLKIVCKAQEISTLCVVEKKDLVDLLLRHKVQVRVALVQTGEVEAEVEVVVQVALTGIPTTEAYFGNGSSDPENTSNRRTRRDKEVTTELRVKTGSGQSGERTLMNGGGRARGQAVWLMIAAAVSPKEDAKEEHVRKCKLRFPNVSTEVFTEWRDKKRSIWPCPKGGFKDVAVTVFWDIENCVPDTEFGSSPGAYASMFRTAFETTTGARIMTCIASLSDTYPIESGPLSYEKLLSLNALDDAWYVLTAAGKASKKVHKDHKEADNVLKSKMQGCLRVCKPEDVVVIISGDGGFAPLCHSFKRQQVKVIVIGPTVSKTNRELMQAADMWMDWQGFCAGQAGQ
ncbi:hypothetical protein QJQ45_023654 [Haematococcus lacustris]|nr:hypothetical protein QJQ45_023654 [Haematococcus lacustris]